MQHGATQRRRLCNSHSLKMAGQRETTKSGWGEMAGRKSGKKRRWKWHENENLPSCKWMLSVCAL